MSDWEVKYHLGLEQAKELALCTWRPELEAQMTTYKAV